MKKGDMIAVLEEVKRNVLPEALHQPDFWQTLDVNYEPPRVERIWMPYENYRIYCHRIHPCEQALWHPHPWPSVVEVLKIVGGYEMGIGYGQGEDVPPAAATAFLAAGSVYEMIDPDGWHYVRPFGGPSYSLMITGKPWDRKTPGKGIAHAALLDAVKADMLTTFQSFYPRVSA